MRNLNSIRGTSRSFFSQKKTSLCALDHTETPLLWLPESLSVGIKRAVKLISNFHHVTMLRVGGDYTNDSLCVVMELRDKSSVPRTCHWRPSRNGVLISPSTVRNLLLTSERKSRSFRIGALLPFSVTQKFYFNKSGVHHFSDLKVCVGMVAPVSKFCVSNTCIKLSKERPTWCYLLYYFFT